MFDVLVHRYHDRLYNVILRHVPHDDALEITSEAFLRAYTNLSSYRSDSAFFTWLVRIGLNITIDHIRVKRRYPHVVSFEEFIGEYPDGSTYMGDFPSTDRTTDPEHCLLHSELSDQLYISISRLPVKLREAFELHHILGLQQVEISDKLQIPVGTVKSRISRAVEALQRELGPYVTN
jgi:RNA polymerase sigma-70 factor (ECF subfamily)